MLSIPKRLIRVLALGAFSFTMSALPGTPAIQNAIPMPFFGTTAFAAPASAFSPLSSCSPSGWSGSTAAPLPRGRGGGLRRARRQPAGARPGDARTAQSEDFDIAELSGAAPPKSADEDLPPFWLALLPVLVVIVSNFAFVQLVLPLMDTSYLAEPLFGETTIESVGGVWAVIIGLFLAILLSHRRQLGGAWADLRASLDKGADASVLPIFNTASLVGFGAVIAALPVFAVISQAAMSIGGGNPLVSVAGAVALLSAMTGSASGGMIALDALGSTFVDVANATGVSLEAMHRVTAVASGALDALPHNGAIITLLTVCKLTHRKSSVTC